MFRVTILCLCLSSIWALPPSPRHSKLKSTGPRIINGEAASEGQFPWQAALFINDEESSWFCGGAIISEEWILTDGYCVEGGVSGLATTATLDPYRGEVSEISRFILHEGYSGITLEHDIGLIQLERPLTLDGNASAVSLASEELSANVTITVTGWGLTSDNASTISDFLNYVELVTISNSDCDSYYGEGTTLPGMVCANSPTSEVKGTCGGDTGSPAVVDADSNPVLVGIASFGSYDGCESTDPSGFTRTAYYREWIRNNTGV